MKKKELIKVCQKDMTFVINKLIIAEFSLDKATAKLNEANEKIAFLQDKLDLAVADTIQLQNETFELQEETFNHEVEKAATQAEYREAKTNAREALYKSMQEYTTLTNEEVTINIETKDHK